tara:strand:- start:191 stop:514 length:324 start_codon:yes stop_codon:yes gene_type:complete
MRIDRLMVLLEDWSKWMKHDSHKLGYPSKSLGITSGGESSEAFDDMVLEADSKNTKTINAIINSLPREQREAIYARWLGSKKPMYYELKLELAMDNLLTIADRRIYA